MTNETKITTTINTDNPNVMNGQIWTATEIEKKHGRELVQDAKGHWRLASYKNYNMSDDEEADLEMVQRAKTLSQFVEKHMNGSG